jgi:hypothetical protein
MTDDRDLEQRLARLTRETEPLGPRPGFSARVMQAVAQEPPGFTTQVFTIGRRLVPAAAVVLAATVLWAVRMDDAFDQALAMSYALEVEW